MLARALSRYGLDHRLALFLLSLPGVRGNPNRSVWALLFATGFVSMWVSNSATAAMMLPVTLGISGSLFGENRRATEVVLIAMAYAANIGGIATPVGSPPNLIAIGFLESLAGVNLKFFDWVLLALPVVVCCGLFLGWYTVWQIGSVRKVSDPDLAGHEYRALGSLTRGQKRLLAVLLGTIAFWLLPGLLALVLGKSHPLALAIDRYLPEAVVAVLGASLVFVVHEGGKPLLTWTEAKEIDWGALLLFGGGLSLGGALFSTGLATELGGDLMAWASRVGGALGFGAGMTFFALFFTELTSNTATANMLLPLVIGGAKQTSLAPTLCVAMACSLAFMLPVATPPNAIVYGSGKIDSLRMFRLGFVMNLVCGLIVIGVIHLLTAFMSF